MQVSSYKRLYFFTSRLKIAVDTFHLGGLLEDKFLRTFVNNEYSVL